MSDVVIEKPFQCRVEGCKALKVRSRGLCDGHYTIASVAVKNKEYTWSQLVEWGIASSSKRMASGEKMDQFQQQLQKARSRPKK